MAVYKIAVDKTIYFVRRLQSGQILFERKLNGELDTCYMVDFQFNFVGSMASPADRPTTKLLRRDVYRRP